jgi:prepilin-type N-terminal cleavage/methylation domain-containing protein
MRAGEPLRARERGFTLIWLMAAVAVLGIGMAVVGPLWAQQTQREREDELLHVGIAYAQAIEHYARMSPAGVQQLPRSVADLVLDARFPTPVRHLRAAYTDPMRPGEPLELLRSPSGGLRGVASGSALAPLRQTSWTDGRHAVAPAAR